MEKRKQGYLLCPLQFQSISISMNTFFSLFFSFLTTSVRVIFPTSFISYCPPTLSLSKQGCALSFRYTLEQQYGTRDYLIFNYVLSQIIGPTRNPLSEKDQILGPEFVMISFIEKDMISHLLVTEIYNLQFLLLYFANMTSFYCYSFLVFKTSKSSQSFT